MLHHVQLHYDITINIYHLFWLHTTNYSSLITPTPTKTPVILGLLAAAEDLVYVNVESIGLSFLVYDLRVIVILCFKFAYHIIIVLSYLHNLNFPTWPPQTNRQVGHQGRAGKGEKSFDGIFPTFYGK